MPVIRACGFTSVKSAVQLFWNYGSTPPTVLRPVPLQPSSPNRMNFCIRFPVSTSAVYMLPWESRLTWWSQWNSPVSLRSSGRVTAIRKCAFWGELRTRNCAAVVYCRNHKPRYGTPITLSGLYGLKNGPYVRSSLGECRTFDYHVACRQFCH